MRSHAVQIANELAAGRAPEGIKSSIRSCRGCAVPEPDGFLSGARPPQNRTEL